MADTGCGRVGPTRNAVQNIKGGVACPDWPMQGSDPGPLLVLDACNAEMGPVKANSGVTPCPEARDHMPKLPVVRRVARGLCLTRPEPACDLCVFRLTAAGGGSRRGGRQRIIAATLPPSTVSTAPVLVRALTRCTKAAATSPASTSRCRRLPRM